MKKQLLIIGITVLLIAVGLSGCTEGNKERDKFIGTWVHTSEIGVEVSMTFTYAGTTIVKLNGLSSDDGSWRLEDGKFIMTHDKDIAYDYEFSEGNTVLTFTEIGTSDSLVIHKQ